MPATGQFARRAIGVILLEMDDKLFGRKAIMAVDPGQRRMAKCHDQRPDQQATQDATFPRIAVVHICRNLNPGDDCCQFFSALQPLGANTKRTKPNVAAKFSDGLHNQSN